MKKTRMSLMLICMLLLSAILINMTGCLITESETGNPATDNPVTEDIESFSFTLTWGCYGVSSYDSKSAKLVKTTDATRPEDYITEYSLTKDQQLKVFRLISDLDLTSYPDEYDPHGDSVISVGTSPSMTLILSVKSSAGEKTITANDIAYTFGCENPKGQKFLDVCKAIRDILTASDEWKALPEYEFFYS